MYLLVINEFLCDICLRDIKKKTINSHLKFKSHKEFERYKHIILSSNNVNIKDVDEILYLYIKDPNKKFNHYLLIGQFKLVFKNNQGCKFILTGMIYNRTFYSWSKHLGYAINNLKEEGYHFNHIAEMDIITLAHKRDMTYDFYIKHNLPALNGNLTLLLTTKKIQSISFLVIGGILLLLNLKVIVIIIFKWIL